VAKEKWGVKRQCLSCGARFYDLKKDPIICPKCETVFDPESLLKPKRWQGGGARREAPKKDPEQLNPKDSDDLGDAGDNQEDIAEDGANDTLLADDDDDEDVSEVFKTPAKSPDGG
jgi:uncharacterized protein (TIGR02300 family)